MTTTTSSARSTTSITTAVTTSGESADPTARPHKRVRRDSALLAELDREWARIARRPSTLRTVRAWTDEGPLGDLARSARNLDDIVDATHGRHGQANEILRYLVEIADTEALAGRIVMQRLLPGLIKGAGKWRNGGSGDDPIDVIIGAAWIAIRNFDVAHRSTCIAPALVADSLWIGFRRQARRLGTSEVPVTNAVLADYSTPAAELDPLQALAATLRAAVSAGVKSSDLDVLRDIVITGSPSKAAAISGVSTRTIRNRRHAAGEKIRSALGADWTDWSDPVIAAA